MLNHSLVVCCSRNFSKLNSAPSSICTKIVNGYCSRVEKDRVCTCLMGNVLLITWKSFTNARCYRSPVAHICLSLYTNHNAVVVLITVFTNRDSEYSLSIPFLLRHDRFYTFPGTDRHCCKRGLVGYNSQTYAPGPDVCTGEVDLRLRPPDTPTY